MTYIIKKISWLEIQYLWREYLWPERKSEIKPVSTMQYPSGIDMTIRDKYQPTFFGVFNGDELVGVNSGCRTSNELYRSRGIYIKNNHRGQKLSNKLFLYTEKTAIEEDCSILWSIPRKTALIPYLKFGFIQVSDFFNENMEFGPNCYVIKNL